MSQFNTNAGGQGYDPVSAFSGMAGNPFANQNTRNARMGRRSTPTGMGGMQNVAMNAPAARPGPRRFFDQRTGGTMGITANYGSPVRSTAPTGGIGQQFANWDQALANAMGTDIRNQQGAMNQMYRANQQQIGLTEDALQRGIGTLQSVGVQQRDALGRIAGGLEQQGQQGYEEFKGFRDQQMGRVDQDIAAANQQAAAAVSGYEQTISKFQDTSAQDAANAAFGMRQSAKSQMAEIDMLDVSPGEKAALKQQLTQDIGNQVTQTVTGIYSNMNQQVANMGSNLAGLRMGQSQQTLAGGQLRGQMGTSFGAQTLDAQRMNQQMRELGANIRMAGEQSMASAMQQAVLLEMQGRQTVAEMIRQNPRQFVSMFAGLTGFLAGATTPGLGQISIPNFGAQA